MKTLKTTLLTLLAFILIMPITHAAPAPSRADILKDVKSFVTTYYYGDIPTNLPTMKSVEEVIESLDEYSRYLTKEEYNTYIGAVASATTTQLATVKTANAEKHIMTSSMLNGTIGYIKIPTFSATLREDVETHWSKLKTAGAKQLIIDLRYNGGGFVESAEQLLGFFPNVKDAYRISTRESTKVVKPIQTKIKFPTQTSVLVNRYSASASEIVAASVTDQNAATLVGETTKGKGTVQAFFEFSNGDALKLTIGEFTGPKGAKVHKKGITPEIKAAAGKELTTSHSLLLDEKFKSTNYTKTDTLELVPTNKVFHIQFTQPMNLLIEGTSSKVELIKHGGVAVPCSYSWSGDTLDIKPNKQLQPGGSYSLIVHPGLASTNGRTVKTGTYTTITVKKS